MPHVVHARSVGQDENVNHAAPTLRERTRRDQLRRQTILRELDPKFLCDKTPEERNCVRDRPLDGIGQARKRLVFDSDDPVGNLRPIGVADFNVISKVRPVRGKRDPQCSVRATPAVNKLIDEAARLNAVNDRDVSSISVHAPGPVCEPWSAFNLEVFPCVPVAVVGRPLLSSRYCPIHC